MKQFEENRDEWCPQPPGSAEKQDSFEAKLDTAKEGDEIIIIIIRNGVVVKFEHRKIALENGNV